MRLLYSAFIIATLTPWVFAAVSAYRIHLVPLRGKGEILERSWQAVLELEILFVTPGDYARFVVVLGELTASGRLPFTRIRNRPTGVTATYTEAEENLGNATWKDNPQRKSERLIKVKRMDVAIPQLTAAFLREAWMSMITRNRELIITGMGPDVVIVDGSQTLFSVKTTRGQVFEGSTKPRDGREADYCFGAPEECSGEIYRKSEPGRRPGIARQMERDARRLIVDVKATDSRR